jgi:excinuclease ABC subunit A
MTGAIRIRGARSHNLKNISLDLPREKLVVVTGVSGSGKSSLAFDTLYAEGQRRYVESLSVYARQFLERLEKPDVDSIDGLSPAIAIEQKGLARNPRSTVATATEIHDFLRLLFAHAGVPHCVRCDRPIVAQGVAEAVDRLLGLPEGTRLQILAPVVRGRKGELRRELEGLRRAGFVRARIDGRLRDLEEPVVLSRNEPHSLEAVVDRLVVRPGIERRLADSLEVAFRHGEEVCRVVAVGDAGAEEEFVFSQRFACPQCDLSYPELSPRLFSFNSPYGACPACGGLGEHTFFDPARIVPDDRRSLRDGAIAPWGKKLSPFHRDLLLGLARSFGFDLDTPFGELPPAVQEVVLRGSGEREVEFVFERDGRRRVVRRPFEGVIGMLERRAREVDPEEALEEFAAYLGSRPCAECSGTRLRPEARHVRLAGKSIVEVCGMDVASALAFFRSLALPPAKAEIVRRPLEEIVGRLQFLAEVGLDYLTLDRASASVSGGEAQRLRLATQIGIGLVGVLYVLDEPSVGLHPRDNTRLLGILRRLRDLGNTVVVVEHDRETILAADHVVDMGPGAGEHGGRVVAQGPPAAILATESSLTGQYLSGRKRIPHPEARRVGNGWWLRLAGARRNNLQDVTLEIPLGTLTCVTGVSGSGKSSLILDTLVPALAEKLRQTRVRASGFDSIEGWQFLDRVIDVDQSPIGATPRSNPATYTGLFGPIRELFAATPDARLRGYGPGRFSFNVKGGRCEACRGAGSVRVEMHFLPDVFVVCERCRGRRYERETLEVRYRGRNIAEVLDLTVTEALAFFGAIPAVASRLALLQDVGLGYLRLGQPATTLSGGEAQRIKLARELSRRTGGRTLYVLDEPTTGLHFADIECLLRVLGRLVDAGNTVVVIEHNLDVIRSADWIVDLGPEGGPGGGRIVATGRPEDVARVEGSHTGRFLRQAGVL